MAHILLASEDFALARQICGALEGEGHTVVHVTDGLEAHLQTVAEQPSLVLLDAVLAVHDGLEACEIIGQDPASPTPLPILILTGSDIDPRKLEQAGATRQLSRDVSSVELLDVVTNLLTMT